jgi:hypothetical protein
MEPRYGLGVFDFSDSYGTPATGSSRAASLRTTAKSLPGCKGETSARLMRGKGGDRPLYPSLHRTVIA